MRLLLIGSLALWAGSACTCGSPEQSGPSSAATPAPEAPSTHETASASDPAAPSAAPTRAIDASRGPEIREAIAQGRRLTRAGRHADALVQFDRALALLPGAPRVRCESGLVALRAGQLDRAEDDLDLALSLLPTASFAPDELLVPLAMCYFNRGLVHEAREEYEDARSVFEVSLSLRPNATVQRHLDDLPDEIDAARDALRFGALDELVSAWTDCEDDDDEESECTNAELVEVESPSEAIGVFSARSTEVIMESEQLLLAVRGPEGWRVFEIAQGDTSTTDSFFRQENGFTAQVDRVTMVAPSLFRVEAHLESSMRDGDEVQAPAGQEGSCLVEHQGEERTRLVILCRAQPASCVRVEVSRQGSTWSDAQWCTGPSGEEVPAWVTSTSSEAPSDDADADVVALSVADGNVTVTIARPEPWIAVRAGTRTLDAFFEELGAPDLALPNPR